MKKIFLFYLIMLFLFQSFESQGRSAQASETSKQQKQTSSIKPLNWKVVRKGKPEEFLTKVAYGNDMLVVIGNNEESNKGIILASKDGISWTAQNHNTPKGEYLTDIAYVGNNFIVSGGGGSVITSTDGANWMRRSSGVSVNLGRAKYENGIFFMPADNNQLLKSNDLKKWEVISLPEKLAPERIVFGNGQFVMVSHKREIRRQGNTSVNVPVSSVLLSSTDGANWTEREASDAWITDLRFLNSQFMALTLGAGLVLNSSDGIIWSNSSGLPNMGVLEYGNGVYIAISDKRDINGKRISHQIATSADGSKWEGRNSLPPDAHIEAAYFDKGRFIVFGSVWDQKAPTMKLSKGYLWTSADGISWESQSFKFPAWASYMFYRNGMLVALGHNGTIMTAPVEIE